MTLLLDVITAASAAKVSHATGEHQSDYPIVLDPETGLQSLHQLAEPSNSTLLVYPVSGFTLSHLDTQLAELSNKLFAELSRCMKNTKAVSRQVFEGKVCKFLNKVSNLNGCRDELSPLDLIKRFGYAMGRDVAGIVVEGCVLLEIWDWVDVLILNKLVPHFSYSYLIDQLIEKKKTNLICECVKNLSDFRAGDICSLLKYFLVPSKDVYLTMNGTAKEWENQAVKAVEIISDTNKTLKGLKLHLAKTFAILLMVAYDEFSDSELCLHYLFKTMSVDELVLTSAISKLNGKEIMALVRYLGKWLRKYDKFPQAFSCPEDSIVSGPKAFNWLPKIEDIITCIGLVIDEHFSTLVLHQEFHDEMMSLNGPIGSLVLDARLCCSTTNIIENLKTRENPSQEPN